MSGGEGGLGGGDRDSQRVTSTSKTKQHSSCIGESGLTQASLFSSSYTQFLLEFRPLVFASSKKDDAIMCCVKLLRALCVRVCVCAEMRS